MGDLAAAWLLAAVVGTQPVGADAARAAMAEGNYAEAYCIWRGMAERGNAEAQYSLGWLYHNGYGLALSDAEAVRWWSLAAAQDYPDALYALGNLYRFGGRGVAKDGPRAIDHYLRAAQRGDDESALLLRTLLARNDPAIRARSVELLTRHAATLGGTVAVRVEKASLRKAPGTEAAVLAVLTQGTALIELARRSGWMQVGQPADGTVGWIKATLVEPRK